MQEQGYLYNGLALFLLSFPSSRFFPMLQRLPCLYIHVKKLDYEKKLDDRAEEQVVCVDQVVAATIDHAENLTIPAQQLCRTKRGCRTKQLHHRQELTEIRSSPELN
jgi:hypothetical protein